jgi:hypothetical protein
MRHTNNIAAVEGGREDLRKKRVYSLPLGIEKVLKGAWSG